MFEFSRLQQLCPSGAMERLAGARVAVFGLGGVGGYAVEALARCGVGNFLIVDNDSFEITNMNRQIGAVYQTLGESKVLVTKQRILSINKNASVRAEQTLFLCNQEQKLITADQDYIIDAVDNITAKLEIAEQAKRLGVGVISSMGTAKKINPNMLEVSDIFNTSVCPMCRIMRRELRRRGVGSLDVVYSPEQPITTVAASGERTSPASAVFVPAAAGILLANFVFKQLVGCP